MYLKHLEHHYKRPLFVDCGVDLNSVRGVLQANGGRISPNGLRNNCFAKNLYLYDLWDDFLRRKNAMLGNSSESMARHQRGTKYCILHGNTSEDRINLHDWNGDHFISNSTGEYTFVPSTGQYSGGNHVLSACTLHGLWLYHGKNFDLVSKQIKPMWEGMKQRFKEMQAQRNNSNGDIVSGDARFRTYRSQHLFSIPPDITTRDVCGPVVNKMLLCDAVKSEWLAPSFRATQDRFFAEIKL